MSQNSTLPSALAEIYDYMVKLSIFPEHFDTVRELIDVLESQDIQTLEELEHSIY